MTNPQESPLSAETTRRIDALARQISSANHLDADLHAELRAHIEDKFTAYRTGELKPSEQDAFLLAQTHFGSPATIQSLFARTQPAITSVPSLFARLFTLVIVTLLVTRIVPMIVQMLSVPLFLYSDTTLAAKYPEKVLFLSCSWQIFATTIATCLTLFAVLTFLRRRERSANTRLPSPILSRPVTAFAAISVVMLCPFLVNLLADFWTPPLAGTRLIGQFNISNPLLNFIMTSPLLQTISILAIWFWWIGPARNRIGTVLAIALAWLLLICLGTALHIWYFAFYLPVNNAPPSGVHFDAFHFLQKSFSNNVVILGICILIVTLFRIIRQHVQSRRSSELQS